MSDKQEYVAPEIVHELNLETRAGSPLSVLPLPDPENPLNLPVEKN
jgi:hypothetical protein